MAYANRLDSIRGNDHVKRGLEVAAVTGATVALMSRANPLDTKVFENWADKIGLTAYVLTPCPCGNLGSADFPCFCTAEAANLHYALENAYIDKIAAIHLEVVIPSYEHVTSKRPVETDEVVHSRIAQAKAHLPNVSRDLDSAGESLLRAAFRQLGGFSSVRYAQIIEISASIAALDCQKPTQIRPAHIAEVLQYRPRKIEPTRYDPVAEELAEVRAQLKRLADTLEEKYA